MQGVQGKQQTVLHNPANSITPAITRTRICIAKHVDEYAKMRGDVTIRWASLCFEILGLFEWSGVRWRTPE